MERPRNRPPQSQADDSFEDETILQGYIARLMDLQDQREAWLEEADLDDAARDLGLSDTDLERVRAGVEAHRLRGLRFAERGLWEEAVDAYRQASVLSPFDPGLAHELARAYLGRWRTSGSEEARAGAERYAHRTLELDPEHAASYEILQELKRRPVRSGGPSASEVKLSRTLLLVGVLAFVALLLAALFFLL